MNYYHLVSGKNGISKFQDGEIVLRLQDFAPPAPNLLASDFETATQLVFLTLPAGWSGAQHPSPKKQILFCLSGSLLVEAGDGSHREVNVGDIWRMEDTTGPGHWTTVTSSVDARLAIVQTE